MSSEGKWIVGVDIAPGTYRSDGVFSSDMPPCIWLRLSGLGGGRDDNVIHAIGPPIQTATIAEGDAGFVAERECGTWSLAPTAGPRATEFGPGSWIVGVDIAPGTYRSAGNPSDCRWQLMSSFSGYGDVTAEGISWHTVTISPADSGFSADVSCGTWTPAPTSGPQASSFGPGAWIVGVDIAPGIYQNVIGADTGVRPCVWNRLSGFGGAEEEEILGGFGRESHSVAIADRDIGFQARSGCGDWTRR